LKRDRSIIYVRNESLAEGMASKPAYATPLIILSIYLRAEDNLEIHLAVVANTVSWTAIRHLVRVGPALRRVAVAWVADLVGAVAAVGAVGEDGVHSNANIALAAFHDGEIVSGALEAVVCAVAELEEGLWGPLTGGTQLSMTGKTHANALVRGRDGLRLALCDGNGVAGLEHLEGSGDFVDAKVLLGRAVVADLDVEGIGTAAGGATRDEVGVDGFGCCGQREQRAEEQACGVHVCCNECGSIAMV
jgi:hypothetical protein